MSSQPPFAPSLYSYWGGFASRWRPGRSWGTFLWSGPALVPSFRPPSLQIGGQLPFENFKYPMFKRSAELVRRFLLDHRVFYPSLEDSGL